MGLSEYHSGLSCYNSIEVAAYYSSVGWKGKTHRGNIGDVDVFSAIEPVETRFYK